MSSIENYAIQTKLVESLRIIGASSVICDVDHIGSHLPLIIDGDCVGRGHMKTTLGIRGVYLFTASNV